MVSLPVIQSGVADGLTVKTRADKPKWLSQKMTPIIKTIGDFCNLKCAYCFYFTRDQLTPHVMSLELLEKFIKGYLAMYDGGLQFIWHGGEPLLAGLDFYKKAIEMQRQCKKPSHVIRNVIQTNATLVTDEWAAWFKDNQFGVGVSLDGSEKSHNHFRTNHANKGTFDAVMQGVETLKRNGISPGFIQTLTKDNLGNGAEDFHFFTKVLGTKTLAVNEFLDLGNINERMLNQSVSQEELTGYLMGYINFLLENNDPGFVLREFENFFAGANGRMAASCTFNGSCFLYFCLEYDGRIYPCDRLSGRDDLLFGDLSHQSLEDVLTGQPRQKYAEAVNRVHPDCAECKWYHACHNGCTHHRKGGIDGKYFYCETRKAVFSYVEQLINQNKEVA